MDFARKQLEKYGWTDGKGLGKNEDGIAKPLKPRLKRSATGLGHDVGAEINDHWWSTLYDQAVGNIQVENKTKISTKDPEAFTISSSSWSITRKPRSGESRGFVRTAILTSGGAKTERLDAEPEGEESVRALVTDDELFAACGGRTAHKGARHGLRAKGKLARIEEQEKQLLAMPKYKGYSQATAKENDDSFSLKSEDGIAKIKELKCNEESDIESLASKDKNTITKNKKKKKKKLKEEIENDDKKVAGVEIDNDKSNVKTKRKSVTDEEPRIEKDECKRKTSKLVIEEQNYESKKKKDKISIEDVELTDLDKYNDKKRKLNKNKVKIMEENQIETEKLQQDSELNEKEIVNRDSKSKDSSKNTEIRDNKVSKKKKKE